MKPILATLVVALFFAVNIRAGESDLLAASPSPDKSQFTIFNPTPIDQRRAYNTDRSSKTDSPYTIDAGVFQIESDLANWTLDEAKGVRVRTWLFGNTNFKIGLTNWADLQIFPQFYVETRTSGSAFGQPREREGFGDTTVRLKFNLLGNDGGKLVIGMVNSLKIPTNSDHLANHVWEPGIGFPINYSLPAGFTLFAQTRIDLLDQSDSDRPRVQWQNPIGLSRTIVGNLSGYVEFYNAISSGHDQPWIGTFDTGITYQVTPNFSVDLNSYIGLTESAPDYNVFVGFGKRF